MQFRVGGQLANETGTWATGAIVELNLTVTTVTNAPPVANDQIVGAISGTPMIIQLTGSDADAGDVLSFILTSLPGSGDLFQGGVKITTVPKTLTGNTVSYTPNAGVMGGDTFKFKVNDGKVDNGVAKVSINVSPPTLQLKVVSGRVLLEGMANTISGARICFLAGGQPTCVFSDPRDGIFQVALSAGTYAITAEKDGFLTATKTGLVVNSHMTLPDVKLLGGDFSWDGLIAIDDLTIPSKNLGRNESPWP